jgi:hypothetical protein
VQVDWEATSSLSERLRVELWGPLAGGPDGAAGEIKAEATGPSPLRLELPYDVAHAFHPWTSVDVKVGLTDDPGGAPVAISADQAFEVIASVFYVDPAPPGYLVR